MRAVQISGSDDRMDCRNMFFDPINSRPPRCQVCKFPDLDVVPQPYEVIKSRTMSPNELALAEVGNFFVRDRVRKVLELVAPGECKFFPTVFKGTTENTPWLLAVPANQVATATVDPEIKRCKKCGEPKSAHPGTQWDTSLLRSTKTPDGWTCELDQDIVKSATWGSSEMGWDQWIDRELYLSVRLLHLLKKLQAKGFYEATCQVPTKPNAEELAWIQEKLMLLKSAGIASHAEGTLSADDAKWLRGYLKSRATTAPVEWDFKGIEKRLKIKLPKSYTDFIRAAGPISFDDIDDQQGFEAIVLPPDQLQVETHVDESADEADSASVRLRFANTGHGDTFCFDVKKGEKEFSVLHFKHELGYFEPYADNFAACIRRFESAGGKGQS